MPNVFGLQALLIAVVIAFLTGASSGGWAVHGYYSPRLELAESKIKDLGDKLSEQNDAIKKQVQAEKDRAKLAAKAIAEAKTQADQAQRDAMDILTRQPPPGVDRCTAASSLITMELAK